MYEKKTPVLHIVIDSREPLNTRHTFDRFPTVKVDGRIYAVETSVGCLNFGDYRLGGYSAVVERKTMADWVHTIIHEYERFQRELNRAAHAGCNIAIVIEGCQCQVENGDYHGKANKDSIFGLERKIIRDNPHVRIFWRPTRAAAERETLKILCEQVKKKNFWYNGGGI